MDNIDLRLNGKNDRICRHSVVKSVWRNLNPRDFCRKNSVNGFIKEVKAIRPRYMQTLYIYRDLFSFSHNAVSFEAKCWSVILEQSQKAVCDIYTSLLEITFKMTIEELYRYREVSTTHSRRLCFVSKLLVKFLSESYPFSVILRL